MLACFKDEGVSRTAIEIPKKSHFDFGARSNRKRDGAGDRKRARCAQLGGSAFFKRAWSSDQSLADARLRRLSVVSFSERFKKTGCGYFWAYFRHHLGAVA